MKEHADEYVDPYADIRKEFGVDCEISCDEGWKPLVMAICKRIRIANLEFKAELSPGQIKEKFGGLRFYVDGQSGIADDDSHEAFHNFVSSLEAASYSMCEKCGKSVLRSRKPSGYWIKTVCFECVPKTEKEIAMELEIANSKDKNVTNN